MGSVRVIALLLIPSLWSFSFAQVYKPVNSAPTTSKRQQSVRYDKFKCSVDQTKLGYLKQYFTCQSSPVLGACGTLGAFVAGRAVAKKLLDKIVLDFERQKDSFVDAMAAQLHRDLPRELGTKEEVLEKHKVKHEYYKGLLQAGDERAARVSELLSLTEYTADDFDDMLKNAKVGLSLDDERKLEGLKRLSWEQLHEESNLSTLKRLLRQGQEARLIRNKLALESLETHKKFTATIARSTGPFYKPQIAGDFKYIIDYANQDYNDLNGRGKFDYKKNADIVHSEILNRLKEGKPLDADFIEKSSVAIYEKLTKGNGPKLAFEQLEEYRVLARTGVSNFMSSFAAKEGGSLAQRLAGSLARTGAAATTRAMTLLVGGGSLVAEVGFLGLTYSPSVACASLNDSYLNAQGDDCEPSVGISSGVLKFLDLPADQQEQFLNTGRDNSKFCKFYEDLFEQTFNQSVQNISCEGKSVEVKMVDKKFGQYRSYIHLREDGSIEKIGSIIGAKGSLLHQIDRDGKDVSVTGALLEDKDAPFVARAIQANKLYAQEIASCCQSAPSEKQKCLHQFNTSKTQRMIEDSDARATSEDAN